MIFDFLQTKSASSSRDLLDEIIAGSLSSSGVPVSRTTISRHGVVVALVGVLQRAAMQLPLGLYRQDGEYRFRVKETHPVAKLLRRGPNDIHTTCEWIQLIIKDLMLHGNHYCFINRVSGRIVELIPLIPGAVEPVEVEGFGVNYRVTFDNGSQDILKPSEVLHIRRGSKNLYEGISPFMEARDSTGLGLALEKYAAKLFANSARPSGILTAPNLTPEQVDEIRTKWEERYQGSENAHKTAVLTGGLSWVSLSLTSDEAQFIETRRFNRNELAGLVGVPPHMIGGLENATFSNIEHQAIEFVIHALNPLLVLIEQRLAKSLLDPERDKALYFKFNVNAILRGDMKTRGEFYTRMVQNGALSPNELRAFEDMNPRDGGDVYLTPMNMNINGKPPEESDA